jgi:hypothetical protein
MTDGWGEDAHDPCSAFEFLVVPLEGGLVLQIAFFPMRAGDGSAASASSIVSRTAVGEFNCFHLAPQQLEGPKSAA